MVDDKVHASIFGGTRSLCVSWRQTMSASRLAVISDFAVDIPSPLRLAED